MSSSLTSCIVALLLLFNKAFTQPIFVYDGSSTVDIEGQYNWTLKYPLGAICEDWTWGKRLTVNILKKSSEADLVLAFGTQEEYFAFVMAYDNIICVPLKYKPSNCKTIFVTPQTGAPLQKAMVSLETQYARSTDFRESLILVDLSSTDDNYHWTEQTKQWEVLVDEPNDSPWVQNVSPLILDIRADRGKGETYLTIEKNGQSASITMGSTWGYRDDVYLYMGLDAIHEEIFEVSGITSTDQCSWTNRPTTAVPTEDTANPTQVPTAAPTDATSDPSKSPTDAPTPNTNHCNWQCYLNNYDDLREAFGSDINAAENHYKYIGYYENKNCECIPTEYPTQSPITEPPSVSPVQSPSKYPTTAPSNVPSVPSKNPTTFPAAMPVTSSTSISMDSSIITTEVEDNNDDDGDAESDESGDESAVKSKSMIEGIDNTYIYIGAGAIGLILLVVIVVIVLRKIKGRTMREPVADYDSW